MSTRFDCNPNESIEPAGARLLVVQSALEANSKCLLDLCKNVLEAEMQAESLRSENIQLRKQLEQYSQRFSASTRDSDLTVESHMAGTTSWNLLAKEVVCDTSEQRDNETYPPLPGAVSELDDGGLHLTGKGKKATVCWKSADVLQFSEDQQSLRLRGSRKSRTSKWWPEKRNHLFPSRTETFEKVQAAICKPEYEVHNLYHTMGIPQKIARSSWFETLTFCVAGFNAIWLTIDADYNSAEIWPHAEPLYQVMENVFCIYFVTEWMIRFLAFRVKCDAFKDHWFAFDTVLLSLLVSEVWIVAPLVMLTLDKSSGTMSDTQHLQLFRLFRLSRTARMARLVHAIPELMIMVKGLVAGLRSVIVTLSLLGCVIYVFALCFRYLTDGQDLGDKYFPSVTVAMSSLFLYGVIPDMSPIVRDVGSSHTLLGFLMITFVVIASVMMLNMLVGVLVEVVGGVAALEKEQRAATLVKSSLFTILHLDNEDVDTHFITKAEFEGLLMDKEAAQVVQAVGVDVLGLAELSDFIFQGGVGISFRDFFKLLLQLRGTNSATVKDIVDMRKYFSQELCAFERSLVKRFQHLFDRK